MGRQLPIIAGIILGGLIGCVMIVATFMYVDSTAKAPDEPSLLREVERRNGCPLDAIRYDAPAFARELGKVDNRSYKVRDRISGSEWWLVHLDGEWVAFPIEDAVDAG